MPALPDDLLATVARLSRSLRRGGRLIASTVHPLWSAAPRRRLVQGARDFELSVRQSSPSSRRVGDYLTVRAEPFDAFGDAVTVWHRPVGAWAEAVVGAGLHLTALREPAAPDTWRDSDDPELRHAFDRHAYLPLVLVVAGKRP